MVKSYRTLIPFLLFAGLIAGCAAPKQTIRIFPPDDQLVTVIYPRPTPTSTFLAPSDSVILKAAPDSLFLFGHVEDPNGRLEVNGQNIPLHPDGGWIAWVARGDVLPLPESDRFHPGTYSKVTLRYETGSYDGQGTHRTSRTIRFVRTGPLTPDPAESVFHSKEMRLRVTGDDAKLRCGIPGTYDMFPVRGTVLIADGYQGVTERQWRIPLPQGRVGWIEDSKVTVDPSLVIPQPLAISKVVCEVDGRNTRIRIPIGDKRLFRVDRVEDNRIDLTLFGAVSTTDIIVQPTESRAVDEARWTQLDESTYQLTAIIRPEWFWGWETGYDAENWLVWKIVEAPEIRKKPLDGLVIVTDPGHGGENLSAIGPTGFTEKNANRMLGDAVTAAFRAGGAVVYPTRTMDVQLSLNERVEFARSMKADLFISLHHNALPQGVNPFLHHGASMHYYHRHALPLAEALYRGMTDGEWAGDGVRYQDLAITRASFCPTVLVEAGFMIHPEEEALFKTPEHHEWIAEQMRSGLTDYLLDLRTRQQASLTSLRVR